MIGATAGRTTLTGEGLQHADGHSPLLASTNPAVVSYDPAFGYEIGHIVRDGLQRMFGEGHDPLADGQHGQRDRDVMYYITVYNEPMCSRPQPEDLDVEGLLRGTYLLKEARRRGRRQRRPQRRRSPSAADGLRRRGAVGAGGAGAARQGLRRRRRRVERDVVERAAPRRHAVRRVGLRPAR